MRKMNQKTALVLSIVFGLACAGLVWYVTNKPAAVAGERRAQTVDVVVASTDISPRTTIRPEMVALRPVAVDEAPKDGLRDFRGVFGKVALRQIQRNEPIAAEDVAEKGPSLGLSYDLKPNQRAVTVPIDPVSGVAGFLKNGDHVDVIATYSDQDNNITKTVLQDVELLAIGNKPSTTENVKEDSNKAADAVTATLAVGVDQMETLALTAAKAKIHLALRSPDDHAVIPPAPISTARVFGVQPRSAAAPPPSAPPAVAPIPRPEMAVQEVRPTPPPAPMPVRYVTPAPKPAPEPKLVTVTRGTDSQTVPVH